MKTKNLGVALGMLMAVWMFGACANNPSSSSTTSNTNPTKRTYSGNDLQQHTGRQTAPEALQASDPSVTTH